MGTTATPLTRLGPLTVRAFMREYWQRSPCLLKAVFPADFGSITPADLMRLAERDDVESRLVSCFSGRWRLRHGPMPQLALPLRRRHDWTLLVQGLDLVDVQVHRLMQRFRFIADARLDDVMASYAVDGGGVGPHIDSYDVFLLQARGRRRWRISRQRDVSLIEDAPLRLLKHFRPTHEWTLDAGDMLYLPPGVAHEGTAIGECITLSIGFRTPSWTQLAEPWFDQLSDRLRAVPAFRDSGARPTRTPARVPRALVGETLSALSLARPTRIDAERVLLAHLTEPKPHVTFDPPHRPRPLQTFARHVATGGAVLDARTRLQYSGGLVAINGEIAPLAAAIAGDVRQLANRRELVIVPPADPALTALLYAWYRSGWLHPRAPRR